MNLSKNPQTTPFDEFNKIGENISSFNVYGTSSQEILRETLRRCVEVSFQFKPTKYKSNYLENMFKGQQPENKNNKKKKNFFLF